MRGPSTALGYFGDPEATRAVFDDEGWGHFGDLGRIDEDGYLRIVGRLKEVINRGGKKISVNAVEDHVRAFPGVRRRRRRRLRRSRPRRALRAWSSSRLRLTLDALRAFLTERGVPKHLWPERICTSTSCPCRPRARSAGASCASGSHEPPDRHRRVPAGRWRRATSARRSRRSRSPARARCCAARCTRRSTR